MKRNRFENIESFERVKNAWMRALAIFIIGIVPIFLFAPKLNYPFVFDDIAVVFENKFIRDPNNLKLIFSSEYFKSAKEMSFRPLVTLSYFADVWIHGASNFGCNLQNLFWLIICLWLAFYLFINFKIDVALAAVAVVIFVAHPANVEIALSEGHREWLIFLAFALSSWLAFACGLKTMSKTFLATSLFLWGLSLFVLELGLILPFLFALFAWTSQRLDIKRTLKLFIPHLLVMVAYLIFLFLFRGRRFEQIGEMWRGICCSLEMFYSYVRVTFFPFRLAPVYDICYKDSSLIRVVFSLVAVGVLSLAFIDALARRKVAATFLAWYIFPALFLFQPFFLPTVGFADRYTSFGLFGLLGLFARAFDKRAWGKNFLWLLIAMVTAIFVISNLKYQEKWSSHEKLWEHAVKVSPYSCIAHSNLGAAYTILNEIDLAREQFMSVLRLCPNWGKAYVALGAIEAKRSRPLNAKVFYREGIKSDPQCADCYRNLAIFKMQESDLDKAQSMLEELIEANPLDVDSWRALLSIGTIKKDTKLMHRAISALLSFEPPDLEALLFLARFLWLKGDKNRALGFLIEAVKYHPSDGDRALELYEELKN